MNAVFNGNGVPVLRIWHEVPITYFGMALTSLDAYDGESGVLGVVMTTTRIRFHAL